jgi:hypothetical protein
MITPLAGILYTTANPRGLGAGCPIAFGDLGKHGNNNIYSSNFGLGTSGCQPAAPWDCLHMRGRRGKLEPGSMLLYLRSLGAKPKVTESERLRADMKVGLSAPLTGVV